MGKKVSVGKRAEPLMHSWSLIKVLYTVRKCILAPVAAAPLRHTGNGRLADSQSCYFRGSSGANQAGPGQLMDQWLYSSLHPNISNNYEGWGGGYQGGSERRVSTT